MSVESFIKTAIDSSWGQFPRTTVVLSGETFEAVDNGSRKTASAETGGFEQDDAFVLLARTTDLPSRDWASQQVGKLATIDGESWRLVSVEDGGAAIRLEFLADNQL